MPASSVTAPSWARFDDFRTGIALRCPAPDRIISARAPTAAPAALAEVARATREGRWAFGYVGYEAAAGFDPSLSTHPPDPDGPPVLWFGICDAPTQVPLVTADPDDLMTGWRCDWTESEHRDRVERVRGQIAAGETYQCNLTTQLRAPAGDNPLALYARLALGQRGALASYLDTGRFVVASASPELFFDWTGDRLSMRPMKGTARRGRHLDEDRSFALTLRRSAKERAENVMIVDLVRNDVSRIAAPGTVRVPALCTVERYNTVLQLTSEVTARTPPGLGLVELFGALFPCGSVTGAPKPATMRLIRALEETPRGVYCGAIGLVGPPGAPTRARFSVAIRTAVVDRERGVASYGAGGGITWSSEARAEHAELMVKTTILRGTPEPFDLLETMAYTPAEGIRHRVRHLGRITRSAEYFGYPINRAEIEEKLDAFTGSAAPAVIRLALHPTGEITVGTRPLPQPPRHPVTVVLDPDPVDSSQPWPFHKTTRRDPYTVRAGRHRYADDVVLLNERGELTETTIANLALWLDGRWWTPPVDAGCLPGIERERLVEDGTLRERVLHPDDLVRAARLALVSSVRGWRAARLIDIHR